MVISTAEGFDIAIAGAGIFGLSIARRAIKQGLNVIVLEAEHVGAGSSGGLLGALMPHMPARWNPKKEFQFQALRNLDMQIAELENDTGLTCGYRRCGRILPLTSRDRLEHHLERADESKLRWRTEETGFSYAVEPPGSHAEWLDSGAAPFGVVYETLAARASPRGYLGALAAFVRTHATLVEGTPVTGFDKASGSILLCDGKETLTAGNLVVAGGFSAFDQIERLTGEQIGRGEKGQALVLDGKGLEEQPAIYCDGLYVVPHLNGTVAIGSTSERVFDSKEPSEARSVELMDRARQFCPQLAGRKMLTHWAGVRPRCNKRDPLIGRLPGYENIFAATGGFKISFGIAHQIADNLVAEITGSDPEFKLPATFAPDNHFGRNRLASDEIN